MPDICKHLEILQELAKKKLDPGHTAKYYKTWSAIAQEIATAVKADIAIVWLTADQKILEAVGASEGLGISACDVPFYTLDWDIIPGYEWLHDGFTSWVAVHLRPECLDFRRFEGEASFDKLGTPISLAQHPAHKGQWDPILWADRPKDQLDCIVSCPIGMERNAAGQGPTYRLYGLLKVEYRLPDNRQARNPDDVKRSCQILKEVSAQIRKFFEKLTTERLIAKFWQLHAAATAPQKAAHLTAVLRPGRSLEYNLTEAIGFMGQAFRSRLAAEHVLHIILPDDKAGPALVMPYWRPAWRRVSPLARQDNPNCLRRQVPIPAMGTLIGAQDQREVLSHLPVDDKEQLLKQLLAPVPGQPKRQVSVTQANLHFEVVYPEAQAGTAAVPVGVRVTPIEEGDQGREGIDVQKTWVIRLLAGPRDYGTLLIPCKEACEEKEADELQSVLAGSASTMVRVLDAFLSAQYRIGTAMPGTIRRVRVCDLLRLRRVQWADAVMLFADIRNFSRVIQTLRLIGRQDAMTVFLDHWCLRSANIVSRWGRLDKFLGDGLLAFFGDELGDTEEENTQKVLRGLCAACELILVFDLIKKMWLDGELHAHDLPWRYHESTQDFKWAQIAKRFNEDLEFSLGIGLNFGHVFFDFFGAPCQREYTAVGDNVNFCARLQRAASRWDSGRERSLAPILVSQTVCEYLKETDALREEPRPLRLAMSGLAMEYLVYEIWPKDVLFSNVASRIGAPFCSLCTPKGSDSSFAEVNKKVILTPQRRSELQLADC